MRNSLLFALAMILFSGCGTYKGYDIISKESQPEVSVISRQKVAELKIISEATMENPVIKLSLTGQEAVVKEVRKTVTQIRQEKYVKYDWENDFIGEPVLTALYGIGPLIVLMSSANTNGNDFAPHPPDLFAHFLQNEWAMIMPFCVSVGNGFDYEETPLGQSETKSERQIENNQITFAYTPILVNINNLPARLISTDSEGCAEFDLRSSLGSVYGEQLNIRFTPQVSPGVRYRTGTATYQKSELVRRRIAVRTPQRNFNVVSVSDTEPTTPTPQETPVPAPDPTPVPTPVPTPAPDFYVSKAKLQFLVRELERTVSILGQDPMVPTENTYPGLLKKDMLISWFDLERPEPQGIYYKVFIGLPIQNLTVLNRTKSEFFRMTRTERESLNQSLQQILPQLRQETSRANDPVGIYRNVMP